MLSNESKLLTSVQTIEDELQTHATVRNSKAFEHWLQYYLSTVLYKANKNIQEYYPTKAMLYKILQFKIREHDNLIKNLNPCTNNSRQKFLCINQEDPEMLSEASDSYQETSLHDKPKTSMYAFRIS